MPSGIRRQLEVKAGSAVFFNDLLPDSNFDAQPMSTASQSRNMYGVPSTSHIHGEPGLRYTQPARCEMMCCGAQDICRDIRKLDHAKSHLTATITAFRRLSMLVTAVGAGPLASPARACSRQSRADHTGDRLP